MNKNNIYLIDRYQQELQKQQQIPHTSSNLKEEKCIIKVETNNTSSTGSPNANPTSSPEIVELNGNESSDPFKLNIYINNVVCSYSTRCHLNLRRIAMEGMHVEYNKKNSMVNMKLRKPYTTATIWSSGKVTCAGAKSEADAYIAARRYCRLLQKMQYKVKLSNYRVVNVLATCNMPFNIDINKLAEAYQKECSYEPELHPGATFKLKELKSTLKLFTTGSITLTSPSVQMIKDAIKKIYPILVEFKRSFNENNENNNKNNNNNNNKNVIHSNNNNNNNNVTKPQITNCVKSEEFILNNNNNNNIYSSTLNSQLAAQTSNIYNYNNWKPIPTIQSTINISQTTSLNSNTIGSAFQSISPLISTTTSTTPTTSNFLAQFGNNYQLDQQPFLTSSTSLPISNLQSSSLFSPVSNSIAGLNGTIGSSSMGLSSYSSGLPGPSHWYYDNLLVDNGDDFLP